MDMALDDNFELSPTEWVRDQTKQILETGTTDGVEVLGRPVVLLTMRGAKTDKVRKMPVMRVEHDGSYAVVASKGGAPEHPAWYHNITTHPHVQLQDGTVTKDYRVREVNGEEKSVWWDRAVGTYAPYQEYQQKTDREIPVLVLEEIS